MADENTQLGPGVVESPSDNQSGEAASKAVGPNSSPASAADIHNLAIGAVARKRGRHPNSCNCQNCQSRRAGGPVSTTGRTKSGASNPQQPIDPVLAQKQEIAAKGVLKAITHSMDTAAILYVGSEARKAGAPAPFMAKLSNGVRMRQDTRDGLVESGYACAEKYGVTMHLPELGICGYMSDWVSGIMALVSEIREMKKPEPEKKTNDVPKAQS